MPCATEEQRSAFLPMADMTSKSPSRLNSVSAVGSQHQGVMLMLFTNYSLLV